MDSVGLYIRSIRFNKQVAYLRYLTHAPFLWTVNYVQLIVRCCFWCIPLQVGELTSFCNVLQKHSVWTKLASSVFRHEWALPVWSTQQALEMIEEALERNKSKQPRPRTWETDGNWWIFRVGWKSFHKKIHGDEGDVGCFWWFINCPCIGWRVLFFKCCLIYCTSNGHQATVKHGFLSKLFTS